MKVAIIGSAGIPAKYGGFETLAHHLSLQLQHNCDLHVYCSTKTASKEDNASGFKNTKRHFIPLSANGKMSILYDVISLFHALFYADVLIVLGVSGALFFPFVKLFSNAKIITNVDGIEWRRGKWSVIAKYFLKKFEKIAVKFSDVIVADNKAVVDYVCDTYNINAVYIPYGADHVAYYPISNELKRIYPWLNKTYAVKVCRIEPENNVEMILKTFVDYSQLNLVLIGNWDNSEYAISLRNKYANYPNIFLIDAIYDEKILNAIRANALMYIHGHSAGGTNPSLIEAMMLSLPVFSFDVSFNRYTTDGNAIYFKNEEELFTLLNTITVKELKRVAIDLTMVAQKNFIWKNVTNEYFSLCEKSFKNIIVSLNKLETYEK